MTKQEAIQYLQEKIGDDEPVFVLRAKDRVAPLAVSTWAGMASLAGARPNKIRGAMEQADAMSQWQLKNGDKIPD